mmetsp:Transcript_24754/g.58461  ORF Transcript_24754/g.58461 Transcript_24754/m.58461 type:complete len:131 (-) Transcript_24754:1301-1693(-)
MLAASAPGECHALGMKIPGFDVAKWEKKLPVWLLEGNQAKFSQSSGLSAVLLATGERQLIEASPDRRTGCGFVASHKNAAKEKRWTGQNLQGQVLMQLRQQLAQQEDADDEDDEDDDDGSAGGDDEEEED